MIGIKDIGWGSFGGYEGPRYVGSKKFIVPQNPTFDQKVMSVVSASEGNASSINMYDRAIISAGFIQWIELGQYSVSDMIGYVAETRGIELVESKLHPALVMAKATFKKTDRGRWRFHIAHPTTGEEVACETEALSRWLFSRGSGKVGTWTEMNKLWAKIWAAAIADLFEDDAAVAAQVEWTVPQLKARFVGPGGRAIIFENGSSYDGYAGVLKAILIAYGVNLPAIAEKIVVAAASRSQFPKWTMQWCLDLVHDLALTSGVSLWPGRYNYKRPALEAAFGVPLPKNYTELGERKWTSQPLVVSPPPVMTPEPEIEEPKVHEDFVQPTIEDVFVRPDRPTVTSQPGSGFWGTLQSISNSILGKLRSK